MDLPARPQSGRAVSTPGLTGAPRSRLQRPCPWPEGRVMRASRGHARPRRGSPRLLSGSGVPGRPCGSHTEPAGPEPETLGPAPHAARHGGPATGRAGTWTLAEKSPLSYSTSSQLQIPLLPQPRERAERPGRAAWGRSALSVRAGASHLRPLPQDAANRQLLHKRTLPVRASGGGHHRPQLRTATESVSSPPGDDLGPATPPSEGVRRAARARSLPKL